MYTIWIMEKGSPLSETIFCKTRTGFVQLPAKRIFQGTVLLQKKYFFVDVYIHHTIGAATTLAFLGPEQKKDLDNGSFVATVEESLSRGNTGMGIKNYTF